MIKLLIKTFVGAYKARKELNYNLIKAIKIVIITIVIGEIVKNETNKNEITN